MATPFEDWARGEIRRLRAEADGLDRALGKYQEEQRREQLEARIAAHVTSANSGAKPAAAVPRASNKRPRRGSKNQFILDKIGNAGAAGLTTQQVAEAAAAAGMSIKRSSIRSLLYYNVKSGKLVRLRDQYLLAAERPSA